LLKFAKKQKNGRFCKKIKKGKKEYFKKCGKTGMFSKIYSRNLNSPLRFKHSAGIVRHCG